MWRFFPLYFEAPGHGLRGPPEVRLCAYNAETSGYHNPQCFQSVRWHLSQQVLAACQHHVAAHKCHQWRVVNLTPELKNKVQLYLSPWLGYMLLQKAPRVGFGK